MPLSLYGGPQTRGQHTEPIKRAVDEIEIGVPAQRKSPDYK